MADTQSERRPGILSLLIRIVVNSIVLLVVSFLVPGFFVAGLWTSILAAVVIAILDYLILAIFKLDATPFGRGLTGFIIAALILYLTQFIIAGVSVSIFGAIVGAFVIGLIDMIIPGRVM